MGPEKKLNVVRVSGTNSLQRAALMASPLVLFDNSESMKEPKESGSPCG